MSYTIDAYTIANMKTFAYQSQTNLLGKRVAFMKQLIAANCGNKVRVNIRCCLHLRDAFLQSSMLVVCLLDLMTYRVMHPFIS